MNDIKSCLIINQMTIYYYSVTINYCNTYITEDYAMDNQQQKYINKGGIIMYYPFAG